MFNSNTKKGKIRNLKVKMGHGGTLDPLATGVLIVGVGRGTKCLGGFLECTKSYECVVLFGAATDSYDSVGKVVSRAPYEHVTKDLVEEKLAGFRGKIMQKPSVFSALKVDGKKLYEYARAGGDIPEVQARPVEVVELEMVEWLEPGTHDFKWPEEEVGGQHKVGAEKLIGVKRRRSKSKSPEKDLVTEPEAKKQRTDSEPAMLGALPVDEGAEPAEATTEIPIANESQRKPEDEPQENGAPTETADAPKEEAIDAESTTAATADASKEAAVDAEPTTEEKPPQPPAARLRMTVTSGFYVRSLCHDLGLACGSFGLMSSLVRSRQGDYELGKNVVEYTDLAAGEEVWGPKVRASLEESMKKEGWEAAEIDEEEKWHAKREALKGDVKDHDRNRSHRGNKGKKRR